MEHSVKIIAYSKEISENEINTEDLTKSLMVLSGKAAGICYMPDNYLESENGYNDSDKAVKRAVATGARGHQSIFDHGTLSYLIRTSKLMAILLNSLGVYATSEKSARYTAMKANTQAEQEKYDKWKAKLHGIILTSVPNIDDKLLKARLVKALEKDARASGYKDLAINIDVKAGCALYGMEYESIHPVITEIMEELKKSDDLPSYKLSQENARYMLSVFTPTVLQYSMSYRQTALVAEYLKKFWDENKDNDSVFYRMVAEEAFELSNQFKSLFKEFPVHDIKNQIIRVMPDPKNTGKFNKADMIGDSYTVGYYASFAALAQLIRHRTIRYSFILSEAKYGEAQFFVPPIVRKANLEEEWLEDIKSLADYTPQGMLLYCTEQGIIEDFALKCKERCCSRTQLETALITKDTLEKMAKAVYTDDTSMCDNNKELIKSMATYNTFSGEATAKPRCCFGDFKCTDICTFGAVKCFNRLI